MSFGAILRAVRQKAGLSQEEMAEKMYVSRSTISRLENNRLKLTVEDAIRWGQITQAPEAIAAMLCGLDVSQVMQIISSLPIGGMITWLL